MTDADMTKVSTEEFLDVIFNHILVISKGNCDITEDLLRSIKDEKHLSILSGLLLLHEDLELYRSEMQAKLEADYQIKILEKKNEQLEQFNYIASHDLQEPLNTIQGFAALLQTEYGDKLDQKGKKLLSFIQRSTARMSDLIHDLLDYTRVGTDTVYTKVDTQKIVSQITEDLQYLLKKEDAKIHVDYLPEITGHALGIRQVFQNIIGNALKFVKADTVPEIKVSCNSDTEGHTFCFEDNGIGFDEKHAEKIFKIFQRLENRIDFEGTGIGLALCRKVMEQHKGKIWVESSPGRGSKFFLFFPAEQE